MSTRFAKLEKNVFRRINSLVEPAVKKGIGSPALAPAGLIVLETLGFKSGAKRSTPLWSFRLGRYRIVSTARGERSFWVKNLIKDPKVSYYVGGKRRTSDALVFAPASPGDHSMELPLILRELSKIFARYAQKGWAFAILTPTRSA